LVCVNDVLLELVALESPLVTDDDAVPWFVEEDVLPAVPPALVAVFPVVSSPPPWTFPPVAVALAP
jgi:hypothetical protein